MEVLEAGGVKVSLVGCGGVTLELELESVQGEHLGAEAARP
jgi:hypothetical protein